MTILAALFGKDVIFMGADGQCNRSGGGKGPVEKLTTIPSTQIVVGVTGEERIGLDFCTWLSKLSAGPDRPTTWTALRTAARTELNRLNRDQRESCKAAGWSSPDDELTSVMLGGFLDNHLELWWFDHNGTTGSKRPTDVLLMGSGKPYAEIGFLTLQRAGALPEFNEDVVTWLVGAVADGRSDCGRPVQIATIDHVGIRERLVS